MITRQLVDFKGSCIMVASHRVRLCLQEVCEPLDSCFEKQFPDWLTCLANVTIAVACCRMLHREKLFRKKSEEKENSQPLDGLLITKT